MRSPTIGSPDHTQKRAHCAKTTDLGERPHPIFPPARASRRDHETQNSISGHLERRIPTSLMSHRLAINPPTTRTPRRPSRAREGVVSADGIEVAAADGVITP